MSLRPSAIAVGLLLALGCGDDGSGTSDDGGSPEPEIPGPMGWRELPEPSNPHGVVEPARLPDGRVILVGGEDMGASASAIDAFDPDLPGWEEGPGGTLLNAATATRTVLATGDILVVGTGLTRETAEDPVGRIPVVRGLLKHVYLVGADLSPREAAPTRTVRTQHTATLLDSGEVLVAGGATLEAAEGPVVATATAELYDPAAGGWTDTAPLAQARFQHTATLLDSGEVLVAGGRDMEGRFFTEAEIYDPSAGTWRAAAPMATARSGHAAVLLGSGRVLVAGGVVDGGATASAELYDPAEDAWSPVPDMPRVAAFPAGGRLPSGGALIAGGAESDLVTTHGQALVFDESAGGWAAMDDLPGGVYGPLTYEGRMAAGLVVLPDGRVVIVGGWGQGRSGVPARATLMSDGAFHE